MNLFIYTY